MACRGLFLEEPPPLGFMKKVGPFSLRFRNFALPLHPITTFTVVMDDYHADNFNL
jgi:hypothetical protein